MLPDGYVSIRAMITVLILAGFGLIAGSFANAVVWRVHNGKSLLTGRSQCLSCGHQLAAKDLVPLLSWLALSGRCRYCQQPISKQYPLVEALMAVVFASSYIWWPGGVETASDWLPLITWLISSVGLMALAVYDTRWLLLPNRILYPTLLVAAAGRLANILLYAPDTGDALLKWLGSVAVASGFFWLLYTISRGRWIGYGDVRLGLVIGSLLAGPAEAMLAIILASVFGALVAIGLLSTKRKKLSEKLAFGPFLILATWLAVLFGERIVNWYTDLLG